MKAAIENRQVRAGVLALVVAGALLCPGPGAAAVKFSQEIGVFRPTGGVSDSVVNGPVTIRVTSLYDLPYAYPELFAFTDAEMDAACKDIRRSEYDRCEVIAQQAPDRNGLTWIDPFTSPDNKNSRFAFRLFVRNDGTTPVELGREHIHLRLPDGTRVTPCEDPQAIRWWHKSEEERFQKERGLDLAQLATHHAGFAGALFFGYRFKDWAAVDGTKLTIAPRSSRWGLVLFDHALDMDSVSFVIDGLAGGDDTAGAPLSFRFEKTWRKFAYDTESKHWIEQAGQVSTSARTTPKRARREILLQAWTAQTKDDSPCLRHFLEQLVSRTNAVPRLAARSDFFPTAQELPPAGARYLCNGTMSSRSELVNLNDGKETLHYTLQVSTTLTDPATQAVVMSKTLECEHLDTRRDENGQEDSKGKFTDRDIVLWGCGERIAKDLSREFANAFPLSGTVITSDDGQGLLVDIGTEDGIERNMKFRVLRSEDVVLAGGEIVPKPPVELGVIEITATGRNASEFKVGRLGRDVQLRAGDLVELKPKGPGFLNKMTEIMNNTTKAIK